MRKYHIKPLPFWVLTDLQPAFYDSESGTVLQQMSRVYAKLQEILKGYNDFVKEVNTYITEFEDGIISDFECFKNCIIKTMEDYIESIDMKINIQDTTIAEAIENQNKLISDKFDEQDEVIENAINYMKDNIIATTTTIINEAIQNGTLNVGVTYDGTTEALNIIVTRESDDNE